MTVENQHWDKKSLRALDDIKELLKDAIAFANARGGRLLIGIEDNADAPPSDQTVTDTQIAKLQKRFSELSTNLIFTAQRTDHDNGGQYIVVQIHRCEASPAGTTDGQYYMRDGDTSRPMLPNELSQFMTDRPAFNWELGETTFSAKSYDKDLFAQFCDFIRRSGRVSGFVKDKTNAELLVHYFLVKGRYLTNLGVLCIGTREQRASLASAPVVQVIKYDDRGRKVNKWLWDDRALPPWRLVDAVWSEIPEWKESYELPDGLFRKHIAVYDEVVIRELLSNALVHRPYTQSGDVFINLYPDRLEITNPGPLPIGVTPQNILHTSVKRNENLAKIFYDLGLMEREGSGYDKIYETLLSQGKAPPIVSQGDNADRVCVTIYKRIIDQNIIAFIARADETYQLSQKEKICLGLLAQDKSLNVMQLSQKLNLSNAEDLPSWIGNLEDYGLIGSKGRTRGKTYTINAQALRTLKFKGKTTLGAIEPHRLQALILEDLRVHQRSSISDIHKRIGEEIPLHKIRKTLLEMAENGQIGKEGEKRYRRYFYLKNGAK